jgi:hypothetical protein
MSDTTTATRRESTPSPLRVATGRGGGLVRRIRSWPHSGPLAIITAAVVAVNLPTLLHVVSTDPVQLFAYIQVGGFHHALTGYPTIDPNAGFITQAFGHLVSSDWLHGHVPWWNPYEGIGAPLTGEMQAAGFFPLTLLLYGTWGFVPFHLLLELVAGWSTYFLLRRLGTGRPAAATAGVAFGLCGTFAWLGLATVNPVAFLPLALLGVERCLDQARQRRPGGWVLVGLALGLSVVAGYPEVAYLDGLLVLAWAVVRMAGSGSWDLVRRTVLKLAGGGVLGAALSAPAWVAFVDYLRHAEIGEHSGTVANWVVPTQALPQLVIPYGLGPIDAFRSTTGPDLIGPVWGNVGGYLTAALVGCALMGVLGRRLRALRLTLVAWIFLSLARTFGLQPFAHVMNAIPGVHIIATYRYAPPSWEMAAAVLAGLGIDDVVRRRVPRTAILGVLAVPAALSVWAAITVRPLLGNSTGASQRHLWSYGSLAWALGTLALLAVGALVATGPARGAVPPGSRRRPPPVVGTTLLAFTVVVDAMVMFAVPLLSAPTPQPVDTAVVGWLQQHIGLQRFTTLGPIQPGFGAYYGLQEVNVNDLPLPKAYARYISSRLNPGGDPIVFTGITSAPGQPTPAQVLAAHLSAYEAIGVRYVIESASGTDVEGNPFPPPVLAPRVRLVYQDAQDRIYELPNPAPFFSAPGCTIDPHGLDAATVHCRAPAVLLRRVLEMPGWTSAVGGRPAPIRTVSGLFQAVDVPAGTSGVTYGFAPPGAGAALAACGAGLLAVAGGAWLAVRRRRGRSATARDGGRLPLRSPR